MKTHKACILFSLLIFLSSSLFPSESLSLAASHETTPTSASPQPFLTSPSGVLVPALSPPFATPISTKKPYSAESFDSQVGGSEAGYQQEQETGYPQQGTNYPPPLGFSQPFSSNNQPLSGFNQPFSSSRQPFSGFNQPFSSQNQPFGSYNQQGFVNNNPLDNGVLEQKAFLLGVVLVSLITFGFLV